MKYQNDKSKNLIFDKIFQNTTIAYNDLNFVCSVFISILRELSQILNSGLILVFLLCKKNGKHFLKCLSIIFEVA